MLHHATHPAADGPHVPLICMPGSAEDAKAEFDRIAEAASAHLAFPAVLIGPELADANAVEAWPAAFAELAGRFTLTDRALVFGHGAGARHAQHFALEYPGAVTACAALSADAWASIDDCPRPAAVRPVRWLIGCSQGEPAGAVHRAQCLQVELAETGCAVDLLDWDGQAGDLPGHALINTMRFFNDLGTARQAA